MSTPAHVARMSGAAVLLAIACGPHAPPGAPRVTLEYPEGLCEARDAVVRPRDPAALLEAAESALQRGCPAEAEALLDVSPEQLRAWPPAQSASWVLLSTEATQDVWAMGLLRDGVTQLPMVAGQSEAAENNRLQMRRLDLLARAQRGGFLPAPYVASGRLARVETRMFPSFNCLHGISPDAVERERAQIREARQRAWQQTGALDLTAAGVMEFGRGALHDCALGTAAEMFTVAAARFREDGDVARAHRAELAALEATHVPGGRLSDLVAGNRTEGQRAADAALEEAAARGAGPHHRSGVAMDEGLARLEAEAGDEADLRAELAWRRAAVALRLRHQPDEAATLARAAITVAARARRADLVDMAASVLYFAWVDRRDWHGADALLAQIDASLERRGARGARDRLMHTGLAIADVYRFRGRGSDGTRLLGSLRGLVPRLGPTSAVMLLGARARMLREDGRAEEALAELEALEQHDGSRDTIGMMLRGLVEQYRAELETTIGGDVPDDQIPPSERGLVEALRAGDGRAVLAQVDRASPPEAPWLRSVMALELGYCARSGRTAIADSRSLAGLMRDLVRTRDELTRASDEGVAGAGELTVELTQARGQMLPFVIRTSMALAHCGAATSEPAMTEAGASLYETLSSFGAIDPNVRALFRTARAEASGRYAEAADEWARLAREELERRGVDAASGLGTSAITAPLLQRAVACRLRQSPPDVAGAVALLDESRGRTLRGSLARRPLDESAGEDTPMGRAVALEREINAGQARLRTLGALVEAATDASVRDALQAERASLERQLEERQRRREVVAAELRSENDTAWRAAALAPSPSLEAIRQRLRSDEMLVYYLLQPVHGWAIVVSRDEVRAVPLPVLDAERLPRLALQLGRFEYLLGRRLALREGVGRGMRVVSGQGSRAESPAAIDTELARARAELYRLLVTPIEPYVPEGRRVIVVPDDTMAALPLASLGTAARPWIARNPIRVLQGAFMLPETARSGLGSGAALVMGDADFAGRGRAGATRSSGEALTTTAASSLWERLPGSATEARTVGSLFGVTPLLGADASEARLRALAPTASLIHLATHGLADTRRPDYSAVVLSTPPAGADTDGILYAYEVERLRLRAQLVVLSACETGRGQSRGAEGVLALDRAFLVAGAGAVVSSLWVVSDASTDALMRSFHEEVRAGQPADVALARAMNAVRSRSGWEDPYFWSAFRLVGAGLR